LGVLLWRGVARNIISAAQSDCSRVPGNIRYL
jgi:hypothetical protein